MSPYNIYFYGEIRKISILCNLEKKRLNQELWLDGQNGRSRGLGLQNI